MHRKYSMNVLHIAAGKVGTIAPATATNPALESAISKSTVSSLASPERVIVNRLGIEGDEHADMRVHGGPEKAILMYPSEHYAFWNTLRMEKYGSVNPPPLDWGDLGENIATQGLCEADVFLGDRILVGNEVVLMVTRARTPCRKLNVITGLPDACKIMYEQRKTGWYLSVVRSGTIRAGDRLVIASADRTMSVTDHAASKPVKYYA